MPADLIHLGFSSNISSVSLRLYFSFQMMSRPCVFAYITCKVSGSLSCSDTQVVNTNVAGFRLGLLPFLFILNLE